MRWRCFQSNMTKISSDADIERIGTGALTRTLPKPEWTHAAHFAAAFWLLTRPDRDAMREMPGLLAYWSRPLLFSAEARRTWVDPDLRPLPF
jgi:hypothetical protein